jgi:putative proteasome-type protease
VTYCIAMRLEEGLLFLADTRTNAGVDNISTYRKLHVFRPDEDRLFVIESAGNLATTQEVLDRIQIDLDDPEVESLSNVSNLHDAALYLGRLSVDVADRHRATLDRVGADPTATFVLGGQVRGHRPDVLMVYPEGNYIRASDDRPFLQIGETKYGKHMLELAVEEHLALADAIKVAVASMVSTALANLSVGPPYDLAVYRNGSFDLQEVRVEPESDILSQVLGAWSSHLRQALRELPDFDPDDLGASVALSS